MFVFIGFINCVLNQSINLSKLMQIVCVLVQDSSVHKSDNFSLRNIFCLKFEAEAQHHVSLLILATTRFDQPRTRSHPKGSITERKEYVFFWWNFGIYFLKFLILFLSQNDLVSIFFKNVIFAKMDTQQLFLAGIIFKNFGTWNGGIKKLVRCFWLDKNSEYLFFNSKFFGLYKGWRSRTSHRLHYFPTKKSEPPRSI